MKVAILAGGLGTRLSEYTEKLPKPMVRIGGKPILNHIMETYAHYGHTDFYLALGYKSEVIKKYFLEYDFENRSFEIDLASGKYSFLDGLACNWSVKLIETGLHSMTGGRLRRLKEYIGNEKFLLTYGDGVSDVNINELIKFHDEQGGMVTVTGVRPSARFGELVLKENTVTEFKEKPKINKGWINGGFFVCEPEIFDYIDGDNTDLEKEPLENIAKIGKLRVYKHDGFWQCMDSKKDKVFLEKLIIEGKAPWAN